MLLDVHGHPPPDRTRVPAYIAALERFDSRVLISELGSRTAGWVHVPEVAHWRDGNEVVAALVRAHPQRLLGYCYVNPAHTQEALQEMERRLLGEPAVFAALKLWVAVRCADPRLDPLMELCAAYDVPVLQHTWMKVGAAGPGAGNLAGESTPLDLLALARRHRRVKFFAGHVGGDWEWGVAAFKQVPNVWLDISGGDATTGYMALALRQVGAGRIVFGTDIAGRSIPSQLAKVLGVDLPTADLERILWRNAADVLGPRLPPSWRQAYGTPGDAAPAPATSAATGAPAAPGTARASGPAPAPEGEGPSASRGRVPVVPAPGPGGLLDANSFVGEWPSRRLQQSPAVAGEQLLADRRRLMERLGIRCAAISLLEGIWLKDAGVANAELFALAGADRERFFPVYTLNPTFPAWEEHLDRCVQEYGLAPGRGALRLSPHYHGYTLEAVGADDGCLRRLAALDLPVFLTWQLEDARMQHPAMQVPDLDPAAVAALIGRWPQLRWIVTGATSVQIQATARGLPPAASVCFDLSRVQGPVDAVPLLCAAAGSHRLVFGTNLPLHVPQAPILELADAGLPPETDAALRYGNAQRALGLPAYSSS
jgi:predicted TIM-barrel fold metal-dependent hydrolase